MRKRLDAFGIAIPSGEDAHPGKEILVVHIRCPALVYRGEKGEHEVLILNDTFSLLMKREPSLSSFQNWIEQKNRGGGRVRGGSVGKFVLICDSDNK